MPSQQSTHDQLKELISLANKAGLYDAADLISHIVAETESKLVKSEQFNSSEG